MQLFKIEFWSKRRVPCVSIYIPHGSEGHGSVLSLMELFPFLFHNFLFCFFFLGFLLFNFFWVAVVALTSYILSTKTIHIHIYTYMCNVQLYVTINHLERLTKIIFNSCFILFFQFLILFIFEKIAMAKLGIEPQLPSSVCFNHWANKHGLHQFIASTVPRFITKQIQTYRELYIKGEHSSGLF